MKAIPLYNFRPLSDLELLAKARYICDKSETNPNFTDIGPRVAKVKTAADEFEISIVDAQDGGKPKNVVKNQKRKALEKALKELALYVQLNCKDDVAIMTSTGFDGQKDGEPAPEPGAPEEFKVVLGPNSGTVVVSVAPNDNAKTYIFEYALEPENGAEPVWKTLVGPKKRTIRNLIPRKDYMFRSALKGNSEFLTYSEILHRLVV